MGQREGLSHHPITWEGSSGNASGERSQCRTWMPKPLWVLVVVATSKLPLFLG